MRLWHKDLISVLPKQQLIAQWRECCAIARTIAVNGTPNHILINRIMEYPIEHFIRYAMLVHSEMCARGYSVDASSFLSWTDNDNFDGALWPTQMTPLELTRLDDIFYDWHNDRYYWQCYHNLEEKYDCGGISQDEWELVCDEACLKL